MEKSDLSFLVVGAGAIGGITAALLKKDGTNVEIVCKYDDYASLVSNTGIEVTGICGDFLVKVPSYSSISQVKEKKDVILLATKATDMMEAANSLNTVLKENGYLISMQNGICEDDLASVIGKNRVIGCVTGWGATMRSPGKLTMTSKGDFVLGYPENEPDDFLKSVADILSSVVPVRMTDNIMGHLYSKLIINSCITSLGAVCGLYLGKMLLITKIRKIFIEIIREAINVAEKMNVKVEIFGGKMDFKKFIKGNGVFSRLRRHLIILIIGFKYRRLKSSSLQSLERGKPTEIDYLNGYIVRNGKKFGVPVPVNEFIVSMIHEIEIKKRSTSINNFNNPLFDRFDNNWLL
ncbi:MAG: ketopantoate reductase family protein [Bacteroidales bacterium]|nr:ketopantoate reductase family protein [Bacteroidales bacterium]